MTARATDIADRISLRIHLLGSFAATMDDETLPAPPYRVQELLGSLFLQPRTWRRERLAGLLFPDVPERRARQRLSHILWQARAWCAALPLETTHETLSALTDGVWLDVWAFDDAGSDSDVEA